MIFNPCTITKIGIWLILHLAFKTVGCKWIFNKNTDMDGNVNTFKARLVMKGYTKTQVMDYNETFSRVAKTNSIRILLSIVAFYDFDI